MSMFRRRLLMYQALMNKGAISYPGLIAAWSASGKSNEDEDRDVLRDLTGNGHDIALKGFAFSGMSGYGGYKFIGHNGKSIFNNIWSWMTLLDTYSNKKVKFKISGVQSMIDSTGGGLNVSKFIDEEHQIAYLDSIEEDGIYEFQQPFGFRIRGNGYNNSDVENQIIIEEIPEYPNALVFDGVDDYGINENMAILTDYTVIAKRTYFKSDIATLLSKSKISYTGAFILDHKFSENSPIECWSFSGATALDTTIKFNDFKITWQNKYKYNSLDIISGNAKDAPELYLGTIRQNDNRRFNGAFYCAYLFNRSLPEEEIKAFIRKHIDPGYLLPSEIPVPDCYYDFGKGQQR